MLQAHATYAAEAAKPPTQWQLLVVAVQSALTLTKLTFLSS